MHSQKKNLFLQSKQIKNTMNSIAMNNLWSYIQGLSLSATNKRWLGERLISSASSAKKTDKEKRLEALSGVWNNEDGEKIATVIKEARKSNYTRHIETLD